MPFRQRLTPATSNFMFISAIVLVLAAFFGVHAVGWAVDWLWMDQLGFEAVFWDVLGARAGLFIAAFVLLSLYFWINLRAALVTTAVAADRVKGKYSEVLANIARSRWAGPGTVVAGVILALGPAFFFQAGWDKLFLWRFGGEFGVTDPVLDLDAGFYVFQLPFVDSVFYLVLSAVLIGMVINIATVFGLGIVQHWTETDAAIRRRAILSVGANAALAAATLSVGYVLARYRLLYESGGTVNGPGYTDVNVVLPGLWAMTAVMVLAVAGLLWAIRAGRLRTAYLAVGGAIALHAVFLWIVPGLVQLFTVAPNELRLEEKYIGHNIRFTRDGFALNKIVERKFPAATTLTKQDIEAHQPTVRNIRLWDYRPLLKTFRQIQEIRLYYQFYDVDVDRYQTTDGLRQVMLSARELTASLPPQADTWVNRTLQYTHGYGLTMSLAAQEGRQGTPSLIIKDLPPSARAGLQTDQVAIYYGENTPGYRIVSTGLREFDYPKGDDNVYTHYQGSGGIPLDSFWRKLLFSIHEGEPNIVLSEYINPSSRIQIRQRLRERVATIAPFLRLDRDPYLVLNQGRLLWIQDAYTASHRFPYSEPFTARSRRIASIQDPGLASTSPTQAHAFAESVNYVRNSLKIVVDAYNGDVSFYAIDKKDPILAAWRRAFPSLFKPIEALPEGVKEHIRYPQDLFEAQIDRFAAYHMRSPQVFYNKEDLWTVPMEKYGGRPEPVEPYYILVRLPGETRTQFLLMTPYTPKNRDNMIAWMAARSDFPDYGELIVFKLPKEKLVLGPMQVEALIDQDTTISRQLSLWDQRGSKVIRGNLLVIPIEESLVYVEPVYLVAEEHDVPQLKRVIAGHGDDVAMRPTLDGALAALFGKQAPPPGTAQPVVQVMPGQAKQANDLIDRAEQAIADGDWTAFGEAMAELKRLLSLPASRNGVSGVSDG